MDRAVVDSPLSYFQARCSENWIWGIENDRYRTHFQKCYAQLQEKRPSNSALTVLISESDPACFLGSFLAAISAQCSVFLANPHWVAAEWNSVLERVKPDVVWGREVPEMFLRRSISALEVQNLQTTVIAIPTGGTSGKIRFALHTWETLMASVTGFREYFQIEPIHSCCMLPLFHVSGLLQFLRSLVTGGNLWIVPYQQLEFAIPQTPFSSADNWFISLVPTQLQRLLQNPELTQWLCRFQTVLLGGAPTWQELLEQARNQGIRLAPTYGMTETASQIATLKPEDFLAGNNSCGRVLPHAQIYVESGDILRIQTAALALGYYPELANSGDEIQGNGTSRELLTDDLGFFDDRGYLYLVGRCSDKIITGGENVFPAEVEDAIRASGFVADICVIGVPHLVWGQAVAAVYVPTHPHVTPTQLSIALDEKLAKFKRPKYWIEAERLPRNDRGKISRSAVLEMARSHLSLTHTSL